MMLQQEYDLFLNRYFRTERLPHIWCPGCGIGTATHSLVHAIDQSGIDLETIVIVSGIGCSGRAAGYLNFDSFHVLHGRAIPFSVGLKLANPKLNVIVFSGDGDLFAIGGNHFIHAARRNNDILVVCVNNFNYGMTGGQCGPTSPLESSTTTSPYGCIEPAFNLPWLAASCGATYVARWTILQVRQLTNTLQEALQKKGFRFIEILSPCPVNFGRRNDLPAGIDELKMYQKYSTVANFADPKLAEIRWESEIVVGKFVDREQPTYEDLLKNMRDGVRGMRRG
jgi:2-oxoglutarate ferredoxin oxidoreductase subunit beta